MLGSGGISRVSPGSWGPGQGLSCGPVSCGSEPSCSGWSPFGQTRLCRGFFGSQGHPSRFHSWVWQRRSARVRPGVVPPPGAMRRPVEPPWPMHSLQADPAGPQGPRPAGRPRPPWRRRFSCARGYDSSKCAAWDAPLSFRGEEVNRRIFRLGVFLPGEGFRRGLRAFPAKPVAPFHSEDRLVEIQPGSEGRSWLSPEPPAADCGTIGFWPEHCFLLGEGFRPWAMRRPVEPPWPMHSLQADPAGPRQPQPAG